MKYKYGANIIGLHSFGSTTKEEQKVRLSDYVELKHKTPIFLNKKILEIMEAVKKADKEINNYNIKTNYKLDFKKNKNRINKINIKLNNFQKRFYMKKIKVLKKPLFFPKKLNSSKLKLLLNNFNFEDGKIIKGSINHYLIPFEWNKETYIFPITSDQIRGNSKKNTFKELKDCDNSLINPNFLKKHGGKHEFHGTFLKLNDLYYLGFKLIETDTDNLNIILDQEGFSIQYEKIKDKFKSISLNDNKEKFLKDKIKIDF